MTPLTCQVTDWFDVALTLTLKVCAPPKRTFADPGDTVMLMPEVGFPPLPPGFETPWIEPAHPASKRDATTAKMSNVRRIFLDDRTFAQVCRTGTQEATVRKEKTGPGTRKEVRP